jgi:hypothetical protein
MQLNSAKLCTALILAALALSACARRGEAPPSLITEDDDAICRANNVAAGSPEYVACRKDRDSVRNAAASRADRKQRDLGEFMLNHPENKP